MRKLLRDLVSSSRCRMTFLAAGHRIYLIELPISYAAFEDHDIAVVDIRDDVVISLASEQLLVYAADVLCGIFIFPAEIALLIEIVIVITDASHTVKVIDIIAYKDLLYTDVVRSAELYEFI